MSHPNSSGQILRTQHMSQRILRNASAAMPVITLRPTVLYVDDNPRSSRLLASVLEDCGFRVIAKTDPAEAVSLSRHINFDLALLDYEMPVMNGARLARELKCLVPDLPVVLISGRSSLPPAELEFVDAHFGFATDLDDLLWTLHVLSRRQTVVAKPGEPAIGNPLRADSADELRWADST